MHPRTSLPLLFFAQLGILSCIWWNASGSLLVGGGSGALIASGRLAGLILGYLILVQVVLISRWPYLESTYGLDHILVLHKRIGYGIVATVLLHPLLLIFGYAQANGQNATTQLWEFLTTWPYLNLAAFGLMLLLFAGTISLPRIRNLMRYHVWRILHLLVYPAFAFIFLHQVTTGDLSEGASEIYWYLLYIFSFGLLVRYRFLQPYFLYKRHRFKVVSIHEETPSIYSVDISGSKMEQFHFTAGQYLHISFWQKGLREPHPFSISKAHDGKSLRVSIKASGDFTSRIKELKQGTAALIEGPFGRFTPHAASTKKYLFIAGGIGITPIRAMIEELGSKADLKLLHAVKTHTDTTFQNEITTWTTPIYIISDPSDTSPDCEHGFCDEEKITRLVPDFRERDIYICGPKPMMNALLDLFREKGVPKKQLHWEVFGY